MDITKLRYYKTVVQMGSVSAAARALYLSQSALSKMMTRMEQELQVELFIRGGNRIRTSEYGKRFYQFAVDTVEAYDECLADFQFLPNNDPITIAYTSDVNMELQLNSCQSQYPNILFAPCVCTGDQIFKMERERSVHIAFMAAIENGPPGWRAVVPMKWCVVAHCDHPLMQVKAPINVEGISGYLATFLGEKETFEMFRQALQHKKVSAENLIFDRNNTGSVMGLARNMMCGIMSYSAAAGLFRARPNLKLSVRPIEDQLLQRNACVKIMDNLPEGDNYQAITRMLISAIQDGFDEDREYISALMQR